MLKYLSMCRDEWGWFISFYLQLGQLNRGPGYPLSRKVSYILSKLVLAAAWKLKQGHCVHMSGEGGVSYFLSMWTFPYSIWTSTQHNASVPRKGVSIESNGNYFVFDNPALEVTEHYFCHVHKLIQIQEEKEGTISQWDYCQNCIIKRECIMGNTVLAIFEKRNLHDEYG